MKLFLFSAYSSLVAVQGCSRALQNKYDTIVAGRSMDWDHSFDDYLFINPRGQKMDGGAPSGHSVEWTSKYGSVTSSIIGYFEKKGLGPGEPCERFKLEEDGGTDGVNEAGLSVHVLYLGEEDGTEYAKPSTTENVNLSYLRWARYVLDNFATVKEAIEGIKKIKLIRIEICSTENYELGAHMAIEDSTGDSAVFEHVGGGFQVYHNRTDTLVMTNEPPFPKQKEILAKYEPWGGNITLPQNLPGSVASEDRFIRLEYYLLYTPKPETEAEAIANMMSIISSTNVPFGAPYQGGVYPTWWTSFTDNTDRVYYFNWLTTPNTIWVELEEADAIHAFDEGEPYLKLKPQDPSLVGHVLCDFITADGETLKGFTNKNAEGSAKPFLRARQHMNVV